MALQDDSVASQTAGQGRLRGISQSGRPIFEKSKTGDRRTIKDKSVRFECVTDSMCGDYSATYTIGTSEVLDQIDARPVMLETGDRQLNAECKDF